MAGGPRLRTPAWASVCAVVVRWSQCWQALAPPGRQASLPPVAGPGRDGPPSVRRHRSSFIVHRRLQLHSVHSGTETQHLHVCEILQAAQLACLTHASRAAVPGRSLPPRRTKPLAWSRRPNSLFTPFRPLSAPVSFLSSYSRPLSSPSPYASSPPTSSPTPWRRALRPFAV